MCGVFGIISSAAVSRDDLSVLVNHSQQRGRDSSGLVTLANDCYRIYRADYSIARLLKEVEPQSSHLVLGHSRLITNGLGDNQPVVRGSLAVLHNGIVVNDHSLWDEIDKRRTLQIDTEIIAGIAEVHLEKGGTRTTTSAYFGLMSRSRGLRTHPASSGQALPIF